MIIQIRNITEQEHRAAKIAAACRGVSLNKWLLEAIRGAVLKATQKHPEVAATIEGKEGR